MNRAKMRNAINSRSQEYAAERIDEPGFDCLVC